jgi:hypothetical protein
MKEKGWEDPRSGLRIQCYVARFIYSNTLVRRVRQSESLTVIVAPGKPADACTRTCSSAEARRRGRACLLRAFHGIPRCSRSTEM